MKKIAVFLLFVVSLFTASCSLFSSKTQDKHYYQIYYNPKNSDKPPIEATLRIKTFEADKIYKRYNLVYRTSFEEMFFYNTHFWAARPAEMITDLVANHVTKQKVFSDIIISMDKKPDYVMSGRIIALDEIVSGEKSYARVSILFELKDYKTDTVVVAHTFEKRREIQGQNPKPVYVVRAMGEIIDSEIDVFISKIYETLKSGQQEAESE